MACARLGPRPPPCLCCLPAWTALPPAPCCCKLTARPSLQAFHLLHLHSGDLIFSFHRLHGDFTCAILPTAAWRHIRLCGCILGPPPSLLLEPPLFSVIVLPVESHVLEGVPPMSCLSVAGGPPRSHALIVATVAPSCLPGGGAIWAHRVSWVVSGLQVAPHSCKQRFRLGLHGQWPTHHSPP